MHKIIHKQTATFWKDCTCFKCEKVLENIQEMMDGEDAKFLQPCDGLRFETQGHYGSTFFDPMNGSKLEIAICDHCLKEYFGEIDDEI